MISDIIDFQDLHNSELFVKDIEAHYHYWSTSSSWKTYESGRVHHAFMLFISCKNTYLIDGEEKLIAYPGEVVYLPKGACYECRFENISIEKSLNLYGDIKNFYYNGIAQSGKYTEKHYNAIYLGFDLYNSEFEEAYFSKEITKLPIKSSEKIFTIFNDIVSFSRRGITSYLMLDISFYNLLAEISNNLHFQDYSSTVNPVLKPAFQFISENNISEVTVARLARACQLSPSGFRSLFKAHTGVSPIDYILDLKLKKAKILLAEKSLSVAEVAHMLGFTDLSYFSKFYKQHTGKLPSKDRN